MSKCTYKDLTITGTGAYECEVSEDFEIGEHITDTGLETIESVECGNCGESFSDLQDSREHIEEQS